MLRLRLTLLVCLFALAGSAASSVSGASAATKVRPREDMGVRISEYARRFVGVPYRWGGSSPRAGFDCSGFVTYVYRHFGITLPHYTYSQYGRGRHVPRRRLEPGDLVFFNGVSHVGLYVGRGRFIHAPHTGTRVRVDLLGRGGSFAGARRLVSGTHRAAHVHHRRARVHNRRATHHRRRAGTRARRAHARSSRAGGARHFRQN
jgi:cell wall-associated NlpC family hydrolase